MRERFRRPDETGYSGYEPRGKRSKRVQTGENAKVTVLYFEDIEKS